MKKIIITLFAIALSFGTFAQQDNQMFIHQGQVIHEFTISETDSIVFYRTQEQTIPPIVVVNRIETGVRVDTVFRIDTIFHSDTIVVRDTVVMCSWYTSLGWASFATSATWTIISVDSIIIQIWSDAVQTDSCSNKTSYSGGDWQTLNFNIDCRSNPNFPGDLFSWQAVNSLRNQLCPYPWRVPTQQDFINLDIALGGTGNSRDDTSQFVIDNYIDRWGGAFGGLCTSNGMFSNQPTWGNYWSQSEVSTGVGFSLGFGIIGVVNPQAWFNKYFGLALRCVR